MEKLRELKLEEGDPAKIEEKNIKMTGTITLKQEQVSEEGGKTESE